MANSNKYYESSINENIVEKPLSPVLNKNRFNRKVYLDKKSNRSSSAHRQDGIEFKTNKIKTGVPIDKLYYNLNDKRSSSIPVPIIQPTNYNIKKSTPSPKRKAKYDFDDGSMNSDTTQCDLVRSRSPRTNWKSVNLSELKKSGQKRFHNMQNIEIKCASGDISISDESPERPLFLSKNHKVNNLNMLYENKKFELTSKTTVHFSTEDSNSYETLLKGNQDNAINIYSNNNFPSTSGSSKESTQLVDIMKHKDTSQKVKEVIVGEICMDEINQLNYNLVTDDSTCTLEHEINEVECLLKHEQNNLKTHEINVKIKEHKNKLLRNNTKMENKQIMEPLKEETSNSTVKINTTKTEENSFKVENYGGSTKYPDFCGFNAIDVSDIESTYDCYKNYLADYHIKLFDKSKEKIKSTYTMKTDDIALDKQKGQSSKPIINLNDDLYAENATNGDNQSVSSKKLRNRKKSPTKKQQELDLPDKKNPPATEEPTSPKLEVKPEKLTKHRKEIDSISQLDTLEEATINRNPSNEPNTSTINPSENTISLPSNNHLQISIGNDRIKINIKSETGSLIKTNVNDLQSKLTQGDSAPSKVINKLPSPTPSEIKVLPSDFNEKMGFKCASGKVIKVSHNGLQNAEKLFDDVILDNEIPIRKVLKPKSLLKNRPEIGRASYIQGTSRKSLNFTEKINNDDKNIGLLTDDVLAFQNYLGKENVDFVIPKDTVKNTDEKFVGFAFASGKSVDISKNKLDNAANIFTDIVDSIDNFKLDSKSSQFEFNFIPPSIKGGSEKININNMKPPCENVKSDYNNSNNTTSTFKLPSRNDFVFGKERLEKAKSIFSDSDSDNFDFPLANIKAAGDFKTGFTLASGKDVKVSMNNLEKATGKFTDIDCNDNKSESDKPIGFCFASGKDVNLSKDKLKKAANIFKEDDLDLAKLPLLVEAKESDTVECKIEEEEKKTEKMEVPDVSDIPSYKNTGALPKRRLGMALCKPIPIPKEKLEKAKLLFEENEMYYKNIITPQKKLTLHNCSPVRITPLKKDTMNVLLENTSTPRANKNETNAMKFDLTPIRPSFDTSNILTECEHSIVFHDKSCTDITQLQMAMDKEYNSLKKKLMLLEERKVGLEKQRKLIEASTDDHKRQKQGVLSRSKQTCENRVPLENLYQGDDDVAYFNIARHIFDVTSQNADKIHFNVARFDTKSIIHTSDGAMIIPNSSDIIGITEITNAFTAMESVDPKLLPKSWVENHYKWIVWKLACYERKFPQYFKDTLCIENVLQQLKYRYDKEIDNVQRSALRKILEGDDVPQKRLILCVADIIQIYSSRFELLLTDGWYSIKASIDSPLCQQIYKGKIKIGVKLIIQGAELLNWEGGCHPLEARENVRLKIGYNNTRRARWHLKLGYYRYPIPFPVPLNTLHPDGGHISLLKVVIARVYPVRYMEDHSNVKIWRNNKAEEKRSREFEIERRNRLENIKSTVMEDYKRQHRQTCRRVEKIKPADVKNMTCPELLYNAVNNCDDPETLIASLTQQQQQSVMEYKQSINEQKQKEISFRISQQIEGLNMATRKVTPVLKLLIMDAMEENNNFYIFTLWRPTEEHLQILKEECSFYVYNVIIKKTGELQSTSKTFFKTYDVAVPRKIQRQLLPIAMTVDSYYKPLFNEFDTVGLIVSLSINHYDQELWLCDFNGRLLYVKVLDGPKICALLDNLKRGQAVALTNLVMHKPHKEFGWAIANQFTIISQYPQQSILQNGLNIFNQHLPGDITKLLTDCDNKIEQLQWDLRENKSFHSKSGAKEFSHISDIMDVSTEDNNSTLPSRLTMTDIAMSLLDTDQYT